MSWMGASALLLDTVSKKALHVRSSRAVYFGITPSIVDEAITIVAIVDQKGIPHIVVNRATQQGANWHGWLSTLRVRPSRPLMVTSATTSRRLNLT